LKSLKKILELIIVKVEFGGVFILKVMFNKTAQAISSSYALNVEGI